MGTPMYEVFKAAKELQDKIEFALKERACHEMTDENRRELSLKLMFVAEMVEWLMSMLGLKKGGAR